MAEEKKDSKSKVIIIVLIIVIIVLLFGGITAFVFMNNNNSDIDSEQLLKTETTIEENKNPLLIGYDNSAVAIDSEGLEKAYEDLKNQTGEVTLEFKNQASSNDGKEFNCYIANAAENTEDMFVVIYKDSSLSEQVYLSGLIKPGTVIEHFTSEIELDRNATYSAIILFTTVGDDHNTMTSQTPVEIELVVE